MASASGWGVARRRVDRRRRTGLRPAAEVATEPQPRGVPGSGQRAVAAAVSLYFLKLYQNQLIQQTESELIAQSAALAAVFKREVETGLPPTVALGAKAPPAASKLSDEPYQPIWPKLELARESLLPPRPPARAASAPADPAFVALGARMMPDLVATQYVCLDDQRPRQRKRFLSGCQARVETQESEGKILRLDGHGWSD